MPLDASPAIAAALWGRDVPVRIGAHSALRRWALAQPVHEPPTAATGWIADPELLDELLGETAPVFAGPPPGQVLHARLVEEIASLAGAIADVPVEIELVGPHGSGRTTIAARVAAALCAPLVAADAHEVAAADDPSAASARVMRSARLAGALVAWRAADMLPDTVGSFARVTFLLVEEPQPRALGPHACARVVHGAADRARRAPAALARAERRAAARAGRVVGSPAGRDRRGRAGRRRGRRRDPRGVQAAPARRAARPALAARAALHVGRPRRLAAAAGASRASSKRRRASARRCSTTGGSHG